MSGGLNHQHYERDKPPAWFGIRMATRGRPRTTPLPEPKNRIREWRTRRNWSLRQLSEKTVPSIPATTIQKHETTSGVDTRYLEIYAVALGIKTEELLPQSNTLDDLERELLALFNQLSPDRRELFLRLGSQLRDDPDKKAA